MLSYQHYGNEVTMAVFNIFSQKLQQFVIKCVTLRLLLNPLNYVLSSFSKIETIEK